MLRPIKVYLNPRNLPSGKIIYELYYKDPETKERIRRSLGDDKTKAEYIRAKTELELLHGNKLGVEKRVLTWDEYIDKYFTHAQFTQRDATIKADRLRIKWFIKFLDEYSIITLDQLTPAAMEEFQTWYMRSGVNGQPRSEKSWNNMLGLIKTMMNKAADTWGFLDHNPIAKVKPIKPTKSFHYFALEEIERMLAEAAEPLLTAILILVTTGNPAFGIEEIRTRGFKDYKERKYFR